MAKDSMKAPRTIYLLRQAQLLVYAQMVEQLRAFELTPVQYMVLSLSSHKDSPSSADLARRTLMTPQSMNELIAALFRKGLVQRREHPDNKRILQVALTKDGARLLMQCDKQIDRMEKAIFDCFNDKELSAFRSLHAKLLRPSSGATAKTASPRAA